MTTSLVKLRIGAGGNEGRSFEVLAEKETSVKG